MPTKKPASPKPWDRDNPKQAEGEGPTHLSPAEKAAARRSARKAGRPYPNLVDNMRIAAKKKHA